jgi:dipeptidyl aminopeptidase/acylaminoacyl peptidase
MTVSLIPRRVFFDNPDHFMPQLSPDGQWLAYIAPYQEVLNIWVAPITDLKSARVLTHEKKRGLRSYTWCYTSAHILYKQDQDGDENWHIHAANIETGIIKDLTPIKGIAARIEKGSPRYPEEIIVGINERRPEFHDLVKINIRTGKRTTLMENNEFVGFLVDQDLKVRFGMRLLPDGSSQLDAYEQGHFQFFDAIPQEDVLTTSPLGFTATQDQLYFLDSRGGNTTALYLMDLQTKQKALLAQSDRADLCDVLLHPKTHEFEGYCENYLQSEWIFIKQDIQADYLLVKQGLEGEVNIISRNQDDTYWIIVQNTDNGPGRYYLFDRTTKQRTLLFVSHQRLEGLELNKMYPVVIPSRDDLKMVSYYTLPKVADYEQSGKPQRPSPLILMVHGGPQVRDNWGYDPLHQWLSSRGYAVLSVNYRSSTGFGKDFINAGNGEWSRKMHEDLLDAVEWAIKSGITERDKVCICGGSYGGYATLVGLTFTPEVFACGVDIVGPSNLITLLESIPAYWTPLIDMLKRRLGGDHESEAGRAELLARSPITKAQHISKPLLIGQGANDPRVKQAESDQFVKVLADKKIPVTYVLYPDEGHGFARPQNRLSFFAIMEAFLAEHLGGECESLGKDLMNSSHQLLNVGPEVERWLKNPN